MCRFDNKGPYTSAIDIDMTDSPRIPGYELLRPLGRGPLTDVFAARRTSDDRICAVKVPRQDWSIHDAAVRLLRREHRALQSVQHSNIVRMLDATFSNDLCFLVLEYLEGRTLRDRLQIDYSLDLRTSVWIGRQIAEALTALHRAGYVHGDVKPENIVLTKNGQAVLIDLGFACRMDEPPDPVDESLVLGTANYRAPELSDDSAWGPSSDWYSFGVTLIEMMTGSRPTQAVTPQRERPWPRRLSALLDRLQSRRPNARPLGAIVVHELIALEISSLHHRRAA